MVVTNSSK